VFRLVAPNFQDFGDKAVPRSALDLNNNIQGFRNICLNGPYEIITEKIIKQLESGAAPWRKPWTSQTPANLITQNEYRGLNVFTLASQGSHPDFGLLSIRQQS
jgi:hypothetical protein